MCAFTWDMDWQHIMYDWDQDQDDLAREASAPRFVGGVSGANEETSSIFRWVLPLLAGGAISLGAMAMIPSSAVDEGGLSFAAVVAPVQSQNRFELAEIPQTLAVYDRERAIGFLTSLQRFSDADLQSFVQTSAESVALPGVVLSAYWADALALATSEIERRGLALRVDGHEPEAVAVSPQESPAAEQG